MRAAAVERKRIHRASFFNAWKRPYALQHFLEEICFAGGSGEIVARHSDVHCKNVAGIEAWTDVAELPERANHQSGADQQHERKGDFADDQEIARSAAAVG